MTDRPRLLDLFSGAEGWGLAARELGLETLGIEWDESAVATSRAAGFNVVQADVAALDPLDFAPCEGLIGSPPCQAFSSAGKGEGRAGMAAYVEAIARMGRGEPVDADALDEACADERAHLVLEPLRWALALAPRWVALEQVREVLPIWKAMAAVLRERGYSVWEGKLSAERYGVPQTRVRAILIASRDRKVQMPRPTHQRYVAPKQHTAREAADEAHGGGLFDAAPERIVHREDRGLLPWVSMAEALGWQSGADMMVKLQRGVGMTERHGDRPGRRGDEPAPTIRAGSKACGTNLQITRLVANSNANACVRDVDEPAPTITAAHNHGERRWVLRAGTNARDASRALDEPAPTIRYGDRLNDVSWVNGQARNSGPGAEREPRPLDAPSFTIRAAGSGSHPSGVEWVEERPATSVNCDPRIAELGRHEPDESGSQYGPATVRVTVEEAAILQSFPPDHPWQGTKTARFRQVGNAIPPLLAWHVLRAVAEVSARREAAA